MACLYADAKCNLAVDLADENVMGPWKTDLNSLPEHVQFFWTTIYYKTGSRRGKQSLQSNGLEYHDLAWKLEDNASKYCVIRSEPASAIGLIRPPVSDSSGWAYRR